MIDEAELPITTEMGKLVSEGSLRGRFVCFCPSSIKFDKESTVVPRRGKLRDTASEPRGCLNHNNKPSPVFAVTVHSPRF